MRTPSSSHRISDLGSGTKNVRLITSVCSSSEYRKSRKLSWFGWWTQVQRMTLAGHLTGQYRIRWTGASEDLWDRDWCADIWKFVRCHDQENFEHAGVPECFACWCWNIIDCNHRACLAQELTMVIRTDGGIRMSDALVKMTEFTYHVDSTERTFFSTRHTRQMPNFECRQFRESETEKPPIFDFRIGPPIIRNYTYKPPIFDFHIGPPIIRI